MLNLKKSLLCTTALLATAFVIGGASQASAAALTLATTDTGAAAHWASAATQAGTSVATAATNDTVAFSGTNTLVIKSDGTADDSGGSVIAFGVGAITTTAGTSGLIVDAVTGNNTTTIASAALTGNMTVRNIAAGAADVAATVTGALTAATVNVTGSAVSGNTTALTVGGILTASGAVTITGGTTDATTDATLTLNAATSSAGSFVMTDNTGGATLALGLAGAQTITGTIDGSAAGNGTLAITGTGAKTLVNNLGATNSLAAITVVTGGTLDLDTNNVTAAATAATLTGTGAITLGTGAFTGTIDGNANNAGVVNFTDTVATGGIIGGTAYLDEINITGGTLSVGHNMAATDINITNGNMTLTGNRAITTQTGINMTGTGDLNLGAYTLTDSTGSILPTGTGSALTTTLGNTAATSGDIVLTAGAFTNAGTITVTPTITATVIKDGERVILVDGGAAPTLGTVTVTDTALVDWTASVGVAATLDRFGAAITVNDVILTADVAAAGTLAGVARSNAAAVDALTTLAQTANANLLIAGAAVESLATAALVNTAGAQLRPDVNGALQEASFNTTGQIVNIVEARADNVRMAQLAGGTGIASGEAGRGIGVWAQGFGSSADQGKRNNVDGYDITTFGGAVGADYKVAKNLIGGASFAYANSNLDDKGTRTGSGQEVNSYVGSLYGTYIGAPWYVDASMTFGYHDYETTRRVNVGGLNETAKGDFGGYQYGVKGEFGYPLQAGKAIVTPFASLAYNYLDLDGYTETGATTNLRVNSVDTYSLRSGLGSKVNASVGTSNGWTFKANARAMWAHEFNSDAADITATYAATGGTTFTARGVDIAQDAAVLGVGVDVVGTSNLTLSLKYDAELKDEYTSHAGLVQLRQEF